MLGETKVTELTSDSIDWVDFYLNEPRPTADQLDGIGYTTPEQKLGIGKIGRAVGVLLGLLEI